MRLLVPTLALLLSVAFANAPAWAQDDEDGQEVCVTVAHNWSGTPADVRTIRTVPVPESFRRQFSAGGCTRFTLVVASLVDWHFTVGDEASATAALAFLETEYLRGLPAPDAYSDHFAQARRAAERDLAGLRGRHAASPIDFPGARRLMSQSRALGRLRAMVTAQQGYMFLAQQYLRAAEFHRSPALYAKARLYFAPALAGFRQLYGDRPPNSDAVALAESWLGMATHHILEMRALEMRMAIAQASFSRAIADVDAAQAVLDGYYDPLLSLAGARAREGHEPCRHLEEDAELDALRAACSSENAFGRRLLDFWVAQAMLDQLKAADPAHYGVRRGGAPTGTFLIPRAAGGVDLPGNQVQVDALAIAVALLAQERERYQGGYPPLYWPPDDIEVGLRLGQAELLVRRAEADAGDGARHLYLDALLELSLAARLARPDVAAGRFRRIATRYLEIAPLAFGNAGMGPIQARTTAYFRTLLDNLDRIVAAEP